MRHCNKMGWNGGDTTFPGCIDYPEVVFSVYHLLWGRAHVADFSAPSFYMVTVAQLAEHRVVSSEVAEFDPRPSPIWLKFNHRDVKFGGKIRGGGETSTAPRYYANPTPGIMGS